MGKTALALNIAHHVASDQPISGPARGDFFVGNVEESLLTRMLCAAARVDSHRFREAI